MMPVVRLPESTYRKLQSVAVPLEDSVVTVIERLLDEYAAKQQEQQEQHVHILNPDKPGDLRHTRVLGAQVGNTEIRTPNWSKLVDTIHLLALRDISATSLAQVSLSNIKSGKHTGRGFHYLPEADVSVQGMQADKAWRDVLHLARHLNVAVEVMFEWRNNEGASYPGEQGKLSWFPK